MPRDLVLVLDTSGSMSEVKMAQAKKALKYCLAQLEPEDRFGVIRFCTGVAKYSDALVAVDADQLGAGEQVGGRPAGRRRHRHLAGPRRRPRTCAAKDAGRSFTVVFFTDGQPTVDETDPDKIVKNVTAKNTANTRIFTFGVGDDVNAAMLDQLADATRAVSTYVRPAEDIETKVAGLYAKISHPVLTNVRLTTGDNVKLTEIYPPQAARPVPRRPARGHRPVHRHGPRGRSG